MGAVRWSAPALAAVAVFISLRAAAAVSAPLDFARVFNDRGASPQSHYVAAYWLGASEHRVEVWRDGTQRLKRRTDDAIETLVTKPTRDGDWSMSVLDLKRKIRTDVDRTNLVRIGHFTDWFALAHSLTRPVGPYALAALPRTAIPAAATVVPCRWYALTQGERVSTICWSSEHRLPIVIADQAGRVQWSVREVDSRPLTAAAFAVEDSGFVHNDANQDIQTD